MRFLENKANFYSQQARKENYPARSVYKLMDIDKKYGLIKPGDFVLDLGCAPGSWLVYLSKQVGPKGGVMGVDIQEIKIKLPANIVFLRKDILSLKVGEVEKWAGNRKKIQAVVSDLSPFISGVGAVDDAKTLELGQKALFLAKRLLGPGGVFVCKFFESEASDVFMKKVKRFFSLVKKYRPQAVRKRSREIYIVAREFKEKIES